MPNETATSATQLDFFTPVVIERDPIENQRELWRICWDWSPVVGGICSFNNPLETDIQGQMHYVMAMPAVIIELGERDCLVEYQYPTSRSPHLEVNHVLQLQKLNGTRFRLPLTGIWPDTQELSKQRRKIEFVTECPPCEQHSKPSPVSAISVT